MAVLRDSSASHAALVAPQVERARAALVAPPAHRAHLSEPDYTRPLLDVPPLARDRILDRLAVLYSRRRAEACYGELERIMRVYYAHKTPEMIAEDGGFDPAERFSERDVVLITYGDLLTSPGRKPLRTLADFLGIFMRGAINTVHVLPFFPYSSDRGFSIVDFEEVDPRLGRWEDMEEGRVSEGRCQTPGGGESLDDGHSRATLAGGPVSSEEPRRHTRALEAVRSGRVPSGDRGAAGLESRATGLQTAPIEDAGGLHLLHGSHGRTGLRYHLRPVQELAWADPLHPRRSISRCASGSTNSQGCVLGQQCNTVLDPASTECPTCGGTIMGRIAHADERLEMEERIRDGTRQR